MVRPALVVAAALLCGGPLSAQPVVERITWLAGDTVAGRGAGGARPSDRLIDWVSARLPGIAHERIVANAKRSWALIERGEPVCHAGAVRSAQREALAYFSNTWLMPPPQLIARRDHVATLPVDAAGRVDLTALLADPRRQGVVVHGRSYGPVLDARLGQPAAQAALRRVTPGDFGSNLMSMLLQGRADYTIEFPNVLAALAQGQPEVAGLAMLPIRGAMEPVIGGVACPRTPWGQAAIHRIDAVLGTPEGAAMLREGLMADLPAESRRQYRDLIDSFFHQRSQPTPGL
ncbi:hypothetical protein [Roseateles sp.]|uniref:hypothetical protein n=1 Tax=Roseateles sp. TaxID=1971397 RepID=UPI0025DE8CE8|nr:hypothetical protein [Roseateles sp.]MBV8036503.1 hypothetical protein [Roseateles sp.]